MTSSIRRFSSLQPIFEAPILEVQLREDIWFFNAALALTPQPSEQVASAGFANLDPSIPPTSQAVPPTISLTTPGLAYTQNFDTLSNTAGSTTNNLTIDGWAMTETGGGARDNEQYAVDTGSGNTGDTFSYGLAGATDRALGGLQSGTLIPVIGSAFTNNTGATITSLIVSYTGEQWRISNTAAARDDRMDFQYSLDATSLATGTWTDVNELDFVNPIKTAAAAGALNGNSAANRTAISFTITGLSIANGATFFFRWNDLNASGADDGLAIDDFSLTPVTPAGSPGTLDIADASVVEGNGGGPAPVISFTVTRSGGSAGAVSATWTATFTGTASASDFLPMEPTTGTVSFADGETSKTITMQIQSDLTPEPDETYTITLSAPTGGATLNDAVATGTITDDDSPRVTINDVSIAEGDAGTSLLTFTVSRTGGAGAFAVDFATGGGNATAGSDYAGQSGTLNFANGENSKTIQITINGDTTAEPNETFNVTLSNPTNGAILSDATGVGTITNDDLLFIHDIQGTAYFSPILAGDGITAFNTASTTIVTVRAVVTAVDGVGNRQGFYITEELGDWDANPFTSEGIFVMTRNDAGVGSVVSGVAVGDLVTVTAQVMEYQVFTNMPRTMLVNASSIVVNSTSNTLPTLTITSAPNSIMTAVTPDYTDSSDGAGDSFDASNYALSFWETVEGMLVTIPNMIVAGEFSASNNISGGRPYLQAYSTTLADPSQINSRGGYTVAGDPPNSPPDTADPDDGTTQGGRHVHDGDVNPDIIEVDFTDFAVAPPANLATLATMGDRLGDLTGIIDFDFTDRKLFVTNVGGTGFVDNGQPVQETTSFGSDARSLTIATFNVENLGGNAAQSRFDAIALAIKDNLKAPDIICVEEIQDNDGATNSGTTDASTTWDKLVAALNLATGKTYQWVDQAPANNTEGGQSGGNIRVGFLYDTGRVTLGDLAANATIAQRREFTDRIGDGVRDAGDRIAFDDSMLGGEIVTSDWTTTRKSLLGEFNFNGNKVFVLANHWPSKIGSGQFWQLDQNIGAGSPANSDWTQRNAIGQDVYAIMNLVQTTAPTAGIVAGGDFNEFYFNRPLEVLTGYVTTDGAARVGGSRFDNLTISKLTEAERYTYTFDGRSQAIDHVVVNSRLAAIAGYDVVHINTGYNSNGVTPALSDHDPTVASFDFRGLAETLTGTGGADVIDAGDGDDSLRLQQGGDDNVNGGNGNDGFYFGAAFTGADQVDGGAGTNDQIGLQGNYAALSLTSAMIANVEVIALLSGSITTFGDTANNFYDYNITVPAGTVAVNNRLIIQGTSLRAGEDFTFNGSASGIDFILYGGLGVDNFTGGAGNDGFYFGEGRFSSSDIVNGGAGTNDQLGLDGNYGTAGTPFELSGGNISGVEVVALLQFTGAPLKTYFISTNNSLVGAGQNLTIWALPTQTGVTVDGSAETDGRFTFFGGAGADRFTGGNGGDSLTGGGGADIFAYTSAAQSTGFNFDQLIGFDDNADKIDLPGAVASVAAPASGSLSLMSFNADLAAGVNAALGPNQAIVFTANGGDLAGRIFGVVDANGDGDYQAGTDYVFEFVSPVTPIDQIGLFI